MSEENTDQERSAVAFVNGRYVHRGEVYKETASEEVISTHRFSGPTATVKRAYGLTINLGNYESARFDVAVEVPCYVEDMDNADEFARSWVEKRCEAEVAEVRGKNKTPKGTAFKPGESSGQKPVY